MLAGICVRTLCSHNISEKDSMSPLINFSSYLELPCVQISVQNNIQGCTHNNIQSTRKVNNHNNIQAVIFTENSNTAQKMKFSIKDFFCKCDQIHRKLRIWSHLLKESLMENFSFCLMQEKIAMIMFI